MAASLKISELNALTAMADDDLFLVTDTSATTSKKVSFSTLKSNIALAATSLIGVSAGVSHLGTFSGTTISDSQTVKQAIQALETATELRATTNDVSTLTGVSAGGTSLGTFTGSTIADSANIKVALQSLETALEAVDIDTDDMAALVGLAENVQNLGTFTGSTIADSQTVKQGLQALETATELRSTIDSPTFTTKIQSPEFHSAGSHLKFKTATNDIIFYPSNIETLQITRNHSTGHPTFTANGGSGEFKFNQIVEVAGGLKLDSVSLTTVQIASESFADNDTSLMTSAAIADYVTANSSTLNAALTELGTMPTTTAGALADLTLAEVVILDGATVTTAELNVLDGVTAGTVIASKALVADANIDITGGRNITITGELDAATGDFSGDVDIDGTTNLDVVDIDGATQIDATVTVGVDDTGYDVKFFGATASAYMLWDESADDLILAGAAGLEIPNAGRFILGANVVTQVNCALTMRNDLVFSGGARNIKFKDNTYNACRFQANNGDIFMGMDTQGDNTIFFQQPLDINTSAQIDGTFTVGVDDTGYDVKFFGDTASAYALWDASADDFILGGAAGLVVPDGQLTLGSTAVTSTAAELNVTDGVTAGTAIASKALVADANIDLTGLRNLTITGDLSVAGSMTTVDTVTMTAQNAIVFEGATADAHESTLTIIDPTADRTIKLPNQSGCLPLLAADSATAITSTPEELNLLDGITAGTVSASLAVIADSNKDITGFRNITATGDVTIPDGDLILGSTAVTSTAAELNVTDGVTAGTVIASKALVADANIDITGGRNITITGELDAATLDVSSTSAFADNVVIENGKEIRLSEASGNGTHYTGFKAPAALTANVSFTLPDGDGSNGQVITTNGSAVLAWSDAPSPSEFSGVTAGTVSASKGVEVDSNKDITGFRNVTLTGELDAATGDFSGDVDIDGTANLDAVDIDGVVQIDGATTFGVDDTGVDVKFFGATSGAYMLWDESEDDLVLAGGADLKVDGVLTLTGSTPDIDLTANASDVFLKDNTGVALRFRQASNEYMRFVTADNGEHVEFAQDLRFHSDSLTFQKTTGTDIKLVDNVANSFRIVEDSNVYMTFTTTNSGEKITAAKPLDVTGGLSIGGTAVTSTAAELNVTDGVTAGTVIASKALVADANIDITGGRNITITGELDAATGDFSGDVDIDGTANLDAVDIDGATQIDATVTVGVDDTGYDVKFFGATSGASLLWDESADDLILSGAAGLVVPDGKLTLGSTAVTSTAAELNVNDGVTAGTVIASKVLVADANIDIAGGRNITITGELDAATLDISGDADIDGTTNLDIVDIDGATQIDATVTVGVDDTGYDVKFFGATSGASLLWDESADDLILAGAAGLVVPDGQLTLASTAVTSTAAELNLLDGSTSGNFTAQLEGSSANPGSKITTTAHYVRMGKLIMATIFFNDVNTSSYGGTISISGLPVQAMNTAGAMFMGTVHNVGMISGANDSVTALVADNGDSISFVENSSTTLLNWGTVGTGKTMRVQVQYIAA